MSAMCEPPRNALRSFRATQLVTFFCASAQILVRVAGPGLVTVFCADAQLLRRGLPPATLDSGSRDACPE